MLKQYGSGLFSGEDEDKGLLMNDSCDMEFETRSTLGSTTTLKSLNRKNRGLNDSDMQVEMSDELKRKG